MGYYTAITEYEILTFAAAWRDLEGSMLSEVSQTEKDKYHMLSLICGIVIKRMNITRQKKTHRERPNSW